MEEDIVMEELKRSKGRIVFLKLREGKAIRGKLEEADEHMNITLHDAEEISDDKPPLSLGVILVRGDNIFMISPS